VRHVRHIDKDVVRRVAVQPGAQALLIQVVANETNRTTKHEQTIQSTDLKPRHVSNIFIRQDLGDYTPSRIRQPPPV
jgi:hypothetical protein